MWSKVKSEVAPFVYRDTDNGIEVSAEAESTPAAAQREQETVTYERRGYDRGLQEGEARVRTSCAQAILTSQTLAASMAAEFERERGAFFQRVEGEVVRLALAIARKILHRESQMDPRLLAGVARVALEQVAAGSVVRLRVNPSQIESWQEYFSAQSGLNLKLEWMGDPALDPSQCRLETSVGSTNLSIDDQLNEIQQGFFDLLAEKQ